MKVLIKQCRTRGLAPFRLGLIVMLLRHFRVARRTGQVVGMICRQRVIRNNQQINIVLGQAWQEEMTIGALRGNSECKSYANEKKQSRSRWWFVDDVP